MKLRVRGDSLRLRLTRGEVEAFGRDGRVEEAVRFGAGVRLSYALERGDALSARLDGARVVVTVPADVAREWCDTDRVAIEGSQPVGDGASLRLLVEKDFACLKTRSGESDADAFPNPHDHC